MARRTLKDRNIRKLSRVGGGKTYSITIPIEIIRELKWKEKQKLIVSMGRNGKVIIKDWKNK